MMLSVFNCCVSVIGCCGKCCSCCVVVFLSIYKFKILVFCFGGWFIGMYFCGRNSRGVKAWVWIVILTYIIHSGFISGYQNRYGDNLKPPTNVYHRMTA